MSQPPEPRYFIAQGENVQGPFTRSRVLELARQGKVCAEMMFSLEGGEWVQGHQVPDLFPQAAGATPAPLAGYSDAQGHTPPPPSAPLSGPMSGGAPHHGGAPHRGGGHRGGGRGGSGRRGGHGRGGGRRLRPHRGTSILVFGILGVLCCFIFGIMAWVMGAEDLKNMRNGHMDPSGEGMTKAGWILGIISVAFAVLGILMYMLGGLASFGLSRGYNSGF